MRLQNRLIETLSEAMKTKAYLRKYEGIDLGTTWRDFEKIPFLTSEELLKTPFDFLSSSISEAYNVYLSSGTIHNPKMFFYSRDDIERISELCSRFSRVEDIQEKDSVLILLPMSLWIVGAITRLGHSKVGATVISLDLSGSPTTWATIANQVDYTCISSTPSILLSFARERKPSKVRIIETTGEPLIRSCRKKIEELYGGKVFDSYGLSECVIGTECEMHDGYHYWEDCMIVEVIEPKTGKPLKDGELGEIVVTSLIQKLMPIIRYKTGDLGYRRIETCGCGLLTPKVWVKGRIDQTIMLAAAVKVHSYQILEAMNTINGLLPCFEVVITEEGEKDFLFFRAEAEDKVKKKEVKEAFENMSIDFMDLLSTGKVEIAVELIPPNSLPRSKVSQKNVMRVIDKRNNLLDGSG